jgi:UDP-GlcNAc:undecaprenyl-phosphate GlcNAc-1-phosphate transferase
MLAPFIALAASFALALALTPLAGRLARHVGALDHPLTARKRHRAPVPRIGGLAIAAAFLGGVALAPLAGGPALHGQRIVVIALAGLLVVAAGAVDDVRGISPRVKLAAQVAAAALVWAGGLRIESVVNPFGAPLPLGDLSLPFTLLFLVGSMNAMNLIDGLDGLAGGIAAIAAAAAVAVALRRGDPVLAVSGAAVAGACLGFLRHNLRPASIFMGDSGSLFLGLVLAAGSIPEAGEGARGTDLLAPVVALGVPVIDTAMALVRRVARGSPISWGDREHLHHRLVALGFTPGRAVAALVAAGAVHAGFAVAIAASTGARAALLLGGIALLDLAGLRALGYLRPGLLERLSAERRRYSALRSAVRAAASLLEDASSMEDVQAVLDGAAPAIGARRARLLPSGTPGVRRPGTRTRHGLGGERPGGGSLEFRWSPERARLDRPTEMAAEMLSARVAVAIRRLGTG